MSIYPIILAGGNGSRLWPLSRSHMPKQFLSLNGKKSFFQETTERICSVFEGENIDPIFAVNSEHRFLALQQCIDINIKSPKILLESESRNTAPTIASCVLEAIRCDSDAIVVILPADHHINNFNSFSIAIKKAVGLAELGKLVMLGVVPDSPETGYGYINAKLNSSDDNFLTVNKFIEKPTLNVAKKLITNKENYWNSGIIISKASVLLGEIESLCPDIYNYCNLSLLNSRLDMDFVRLDPIEYNKCPSISIDYAIMEKTNKAVLLPLDSGWSDVGAWSSMWAVSNKDENHNVCFGDVHVLDASNNYIYSDKRLIALVGVDNLAVIDTADAVLICNMSNAQDVKNIVEKFKLLQRPELDFHREVFRPWGSYDNLDEGCRFKVKHIKVKPGGQLSLQLHHHRAEHWIVVSGIAEVQIADKVKLVGENESIYVPVGVQHSLRNPGKVHLHLIEIQTGTYLGEDDIVRYNDVYGRS